MSRPEYLLVCDVHQTSIRTDDPAKIEAFDRDHRGCFYYDDADTPDAAHGGPGEGRGEA